MPSSKSRDTHRPVEIHAGSQTRAPAPSVASAGAPFVLDGSVSGKAPTVAHIQDSDKREPSDLNPRWTIARRRAKRFGSEYTLVQSARRRALRAALDTPHGPRRSVLRAPLCPAAALEMLGARHPQAAHK